MSHHEWDDDACCIHCNFDGAEWHWWKHSTYEGRAQPDARMPRCTDKREAEAAIDRMADDAQRLGLGY